ncbi:MAG: hypothetical protein IPJ82_07585 [Lewinellaceae bacterium]|nr:hypothetical protein [Lewinellaceae bacterium]
MEFTSPFIGSTVAYTNFTGNSDPDCLYFSLQNPPCSDYYLVDINPPICTNLTPTGTIIFLNSNTVCHYENGNFTYATSQECEDFMMACKDPLLSFAKHFIPDPPDCKLWEGPCATESGIWRNGAVAIGAPVSPLKLTVKGGITTEMLQICQPAWCDYVFSDTFRLRPLGEVEAFIRAYRFLPGCTPGKVIDAQGGFFLDVETVNQQQKIEEIFLHLIDIQKRLD